MRVRIADGYKEVQSVALKRDNNNFFYIELIDQRRLPHTLEFIQTYSVGEAVNWITDMAVRGAPAIGATGAFAFVIGLQALQATDKEVLHNLRERIVNARPTAKDLDTFVTEMYNFTLQLPTINLEEIAKRAQTLAKTSKEECRLIGEHAKSLIKENMGVLTHCNAGALATVDYGTALAPMRLAHNDGVDFKVFVDETRPRLQGMLTAWELLQEGIDHEIIVDNAAGFFMQQGKIQLVITGTDRVLSDGTVTNKIGTLEKAVLANYFGIPVYIAMPWTTFDPDLHDASSIPIEFRADAEITEIRGAKEALNIAPHGSKATNPAFDITPPEFITGYITRDGILKADQLKDAYTRYLEFQP